MSKPQYKFSDIASFRPYRSNCCFCGAESAVCLTMDQCVSDASMCSKCVRELADYMDKNKPELVNPIIDPSAADLLVWGKKTLERKKIDIEPFLNDLQELVDTDRLNETPKLYEKYPAVRIGVRRALLVLKERKGT